MQFSARTLALTVPRIGQPPNEAEREICGETGDVCLAVLRVTQSETLAQVAVYLMTPLKILLIVVIAFFVHRFLQRAITHFLEGLETSARRTIAKTKGDGAASLLAPTTISPRARQRAETMGGVMRSLAKAAVGIFAVLLILGEIGINLGPLIAGAGIVGIALGFGSQTLVKDFLSGIFMVIEDQFGVGDIIDAGEASGTVEAISLRTTRLRDVNGTLWHIPNGEIRRVGNFSQEWSRALLDLEVAYATDLGRAEEVIKRVADDLWRSERFRGSVLEEPEIWGVEMLGANGVAIRLVVKTKPADQWKVLRALRRDIKEAFDAEGIEIPFPQQTVWVRGADGDEPASPYAVPPAGSESRQQG
jgi:moderate conductance mechanosensitive channel